MGEVKIKSLIEIEGWALVAAKDVSEEQKEISGTEAFISFMWHECEAIKFEHGDDDDKEEIRYLDEEDSQMGKCWFCMVKAPVDIKTLWTIHNMSIMHQFTDPTTDSWDPKYVTSRVKDIERLKKHGRKEGWYHG